MTPDDRPVPAQPAPSEPALRTPEKASDRDEVPPGSVVVGVDGSDKDRRVLEFAASEADLEGAPLHLVMAHEIHTGLVGSWDAGFVPAGIDVELARASEETLQRLTAEVTTATPRVAVTSSHPWATPSQALLDAATRARLVVVGTARKGGLEKVLLGTTSLNTAMHAPCPVAVVGAEPARVGHVVVGVDGSAHGALATRWAAAAAAARGVGLTVVSTWWLEIVGGAVVTEEGTPEWEQVEARHRQVAEDAIGDARTVHPGLTIDILVTNARPVATLLEQAADASLLVVGSRGRGGFTGMTLGSVSHKLLQRATCPVVVTRVPRVH